MTSRYVYPAAEAARAIAEQVWFMTDAGLAELEEHARRRLDESYTRHVAQQRTSWWAERALAEAATLESGVAVIRLYGSIWPKMCFSVWWRDGTSLDVFGQAFTAAIDDPQCRAILIDIDSPGGLAAGVEEASQLVYDARGAKPIVAIASGRQACSAAYFIGSAADELVASPSAVVGSIGAIYWHEDRSRLLEAMGIRLTAIKSGSHKADGNPFEPLDKPAAAALQQLIDDSGRQFVEAVARNREITEQDVLANYGQGRIFLAPRALEQGLVDRLATFAEVLDELAGARQPDPFRSLENQAMTKTAQPGDSQQASAIQAEAAAQPQAAAPANAAPAAAKPAASGANPSSGEQPPAAQTPPATQPGAAAAAASSEPDEAKRQAWAEAREIVARCTLAGVDPTPYLEAGLSVGEVADKLLAHVCRQRQLTPDPGEPQQAAAKPDEELRKQYRANQSLARQGISEDRFVALITGGEVSYLDTACKLQLEQAAQN